MDIRGDQKVVVYENGVMIYDGLWENADGEIKDAGSDWFLLHESEYAEIIVILP